MTSEMTHKPNMIRSRIRGVHGSPHYCVNHKVLPTYLGTEHKEKNQTYMHNIMSYNTQNI
ncbi:hypothetical protein Hanom_Chr08g00754631 [Helianthus anomalus]